MSPRSESPDRRVLPRRIFLLAPLAVALLLFLGSVGASSALAGLAFQSFENTFINPDGSPDLLAGSHPWEMVTRFKLGDATNRFGEPVPDGDLKNTRVELPAGLVGNPAATLKCTEKEFFTVNPNVNSGGALPGGDCPDYSQIGVVRAANAGEQPAWVALYNLVPPAGVPAEFGFNFYGTPVLLLPSVRTGGDNGITVESVDTPQGFALDQFTAFLWGVPGDPRHDEFRGECLTVAGESECSHAFPGTVEPFLSLPTRCSTSLETRIHADSWEEPGVFIQGSAFSGESEGAPVGLTGCDRMSFSPQLTVSPDTSAADTPAGLTVDVKPPLGGLLDPEGVSSADLKNTAVVLPAGMVINPGQAAGLEACQPAQDALTTEAEKAEGKEDTAAPSCPLGSKVGTVKIQTPLLEGLTEPELIGNVYVLQSNPPHLRLLVAASADGINVKLVGDVELDESTGRLTTTFSETPQLPFTDFKLQFSGGARAALVTPALCGAYTTSADFTPWSSPSEADALTGAEFNIDSGPNDTACVSTLPFAPSLSAGSTTDQAGGFTHFSLLLQRGDGQQRISSLRFKTPEGLLGMISKVPLCGEPQASKGECAATSQIGHTVVEAGPGPYPLVVPQPGQPPAPIYLTGGYKGAPYGLSIVVPLVVGPFTLQTQIVRAKIEVDPRTAQLTVTTDSLPSIVDGIPTDLRAINAVIDREGFMFNPTDCNPQSFAGTATSTEGAQAAISTPFQVGSCQSLKFKPDFKVSTQGRTSKADGASLTAKIIYPTTPPGANQASSQANIARVKVDLPKQLPSRLTTLQKACTAATFEANPANCPAASVVGHATAITPVLPVPLNGPAYFVSHGGEAFPSLIVVLQGYGVTVDLVGTTFISKQGITSSTFKQVPDVPVGSFELTLPEGKYSALAANLPAKDKGSFCGQSLAMPTAFVAQNGAEIHESTKITVTNCPKAKKAKKHHKHAKSKKKGHR